MTLYPDKTIPITVVKTETFITRVSADELGRSIIYYVAETLGISDDAGCSWITQGNYSYIGGSEWQISTDPEIATLIDAANILIYGRTLTLTDTIEIEKMA